LSIGHVSPEAAEGGNIGLVREGDSIEIDIPGRSIRVAVSDDVLAQRRKEEAARGAKAWRPVSRERPVSTWLRTYATLAKSAAYGGVRDTSRLR
jgi:dihydroxy-acid dehydratase